MRSVAVAVSPSRTRAKNKQPAIWFAENNLQVGLTSNMQAEISTIKQLTRERDGETFKRKIRKLQETNI